MANKDIEQKINSAFSKTVPDILDSILADCDEVPEAQPEPSKKPKNRIRMMKTVALAAALIMLIAGTVTAVGVRNMSFVGRDNALGSAMNYVVNNADSEEQRQMLSDFILSGLAYDEFTEETKVDFGLVGLRPAYHIHFKVGGFSYDIDVDARSGVVMSCERSVDEGWEEHLQSDRSELSKVQFYSDFDIPDTLDQETINNTVIGDISDNDAYLIAEDYFGLDMIGYMGDGCVHSMQGHAKADYSAEVLRYLMQIRHGGYVYECIVDSVSGEVSKPLVTIDTLEINYEIGEMHLHEKSEYIGRYRARQIACEEFGGERISAMWPSLMQTEYEQGGMMWPSGYDVDVYTVMIILDEQASSVYLAIDAHTGEIISTEAPTVGAARLPNQEPSLDAPDGMISEAAALAIALSDSGVDHNYMESLTIDLEDNVYNIRFYGTNGKGAYILFKYEVDARDGKILSSEKTDR